MKKLCLVFVLFALIGFSAFGYDDEEEIDFLLFLPDSSNQFADEEVAMEHLDNVAKYLMNRDLTPGQIHVDGYAAVADNNIDSMDLSRNRAIFVMNELLKRGVPEILFSDPAAFGSVDFWGSNMNENNRTQNRRVRIVLDGNFLTLGTLEAFASENKASVIDNDEEAIKRENETDRLCCVLPWILLFLLLLTALIAEILFFAWRYRKNIKTLEADNRLLAASAATGYIIVNLENEIRRRAYELYLERNGQSEDADRDWWKAVAEICACYEAAGYKTYTADGCWWARK